MTKEEDFDDKPDDELIEFHLSSAEDRTWVQLKITAETPISQAQYEIMLLDFVTSLRLGKSCNNHEWLLDDEMEPQ